MSLSAFLGLDQTRIQSDFGFTESVYQHMRVPDRLKVVGLGEDKRPPVLQEEMPPLAYNMYIPERLSVAVETSDAGLRLPLNHLQQDISVLDTSSDTNENQRMKTEKTPASPPVRQKGSQRRSRKHHSQSLSVSSHEHSRAQVQPAPSPSPSAPLFPPFPSFEHNGNLFTVHNVYHTAKYLGQGISRLMVQSLVKKVHRSSGDSGNVSNVVSHDLNPKDVTAMRKQLTQISHRLDLLEKEVPIHKRKELLLLSAVVLAAVVNGWLWLRR
ncbi:mitochondrial fission factor homolog A-like isoform X2 [Protopterus annectens]|uniref:mitochondrial fission factor homolog A-like isoform X2 n=1 Tax=Protopterus annectens TaxID=7888 RepID=UPI001CFAF5F3|nr:mitochondrial fission factor homolog A-like isoform X2 [Protopterus annectens]